MSSPVPNNNFAPSLTLNNAVPVKGVDHEVDQHHPQIVDDQPASDTLRDEQPEQEVELEIDHILPSQVDALQDHHDQQPDHPHQGSQSPSLSSFCSTIEIKQSHTKQWAKNFNGA